MRRVEKVQQFVLTAISAVVVLLLALIVFWRIETDNVPLETIEATVLEKTDQWSKKPFRGVVFWIWVRLDSKKEKIPVESEIYKSLAEGDRVVVTFRRGSLTGRMRIIRVEPKPKQRSGVHKSRSLFVYKVFFLKSMALTATMTVLRDINRAASAG